MVTKWKNTIEKIMKICDKPKLSIPVAMGCDVIAIMIFIHLIESYFRTEKFYCGLIIANIFLVISYVLILQTIWTRKYERRLSETEYSYQNWKQDFSALQWKTLLTGPVLLLLAYLIINSEFGRWYFYWPAEITIYFSTVIFIFTLGLTFICFMRKLLDTIIEKTAATNEKIVSAAVEASIRSEKLKVDLISNVSHDLKTPLTSIIGYIDLMKKEELSDTMADYVEVLSNKSEKLKEMIESLFSLAKTSSGNMELKPEPLQLNRMVEQITADMSDRISTSGLEFIIELTSEDTELITDSSYLYRVCQNLIENALKYSAKGTRVFLKTMSTPISTAVSDGESAAARRTVSFEVTNTASYRMNFTKDQIVERFTRGDEARSTEGNGLGLAIVNTYTTALGGRFDVSIDCDQFKAVIEFEILAVQLPVE